MVTWYMMGSIAMTAIAVVAVFYGLKDAHVIRRWPLTTGFGLLIAVCLLTALISTQEWGGLVAFMAGIFIVIIVIIAGLVLLMVLPKWRKTVVLLVSVVFPLLFWQSILVGSEISPGTITRKNGVLIAQALNAYHDDNHLYPMTLEELLPKYLTTIPNEPQSPGGWLYKLTSDGFALGYVDWVDKLGYGVCILAPRVMDWNCLPSTYDAEPFNLGPTPVPTKNRTR